MRFEPYKFTTQTLLRTLGVVALLLVGRLIAPGRLEASTLTYTLDSGSSTISGTLGVIAFSNATYTVTATADPTTVQSGTIDGAVPYNQLGVTPTLSLFVSGSQVASVALLPTLGRDWVVFSADASGFLGVGFDGFGLDLSGGPDPFGFSIEGPAAENFNSLQSVDSYSGVTRTPGSFTVGEAYATTGGALQIDTADAFSGSSFMISVPEPSTSCMALAGLACGGHFMFRRRKQA